jgi:PIN domain nuclease of toxin-antitoxin system
MSVELLLDTHALLSWLADDPQLSADARTAIADPDSVVAVSAASAWEIAIKSAAGKLRAPAELEQQLRRERFVPLPIRLPHALRACALPPHHADPFDRMLVAQAELEGLTLVTRDSALSRYGVATLAA